MKRTIRFARLSFERTLSYYEDGYDVLGKRKEALLDVIDYHTDINELLRQTPRRSLRRRGEWHFGDVIPDEYVISARLGKEKRDTRRRRDPEKKGFVEEYIEDNNIAFFVIDLEESILAYESRLEVGNKAPYWILEAIFNQYHEGEHELSITPITDKEEVRRDLQRISRVTKVRFKNLSRANPDSTDLSEPMETFLEEGRIETLNLRAENNFEQAIEGINLDHPLLNGGLSLAEEGYGTAEISGKAVSGEDISVTTERQQKRTRVNEADTDRMYRKRLIEQIDEILEELNRNE